MAQSKPWYYPIHISDLVSMEDWVGLAAQRNWEICWYDIHMESKPDLSHGSTQRFTHYATAVYAKDTKLVYHIPGTEEPFTFAKYKQELGNLCSKICFYLRKDDEYQYHSSLLKAFGDSVSQIYSFLWCTLCIYVRY